MYNAKHNQEIAKELTNRSLFQIIAETSLLVVIALTAFVGNTLVLFVFYKSPDLRKKVVSFYLQTLAVSDIIASALFMPSLITTSACGCDFIGFNWGQYLGVVSIALVYGSILTTSMIAVNRFFCVVKPRIYRQFFQRKMTIGTIAIIWFISLGSVIQATATNDVIFYFYPGRYMYYPAYTDYTKERIMGVFTHIVAGFLPLLLTIYCYIKIHAKVQVHSMSVNKRSTNKTLTVEEVHLTKSLVAIVAGFVFCWLTGTTIIHIDIYYDLPRPLEMIMVYLGCLSSAINPVIYNTVNRRFRRQLLQIFHQRTIDNKSHIISLKPTLSYRYVEKTTP